MSSSIVPIIFSLENQYGVLVDLSTEPTFYFSASNTWDGTSIDFSAIPPSSSLTPVSSSFAIPATTGTYISEYDLDVKNLTDGIYIGKISTTSANYYQTVTQFSVIGGMSGPESTSIPRLGPYRTWIGASGSAPINGVAYAIYDSNMKPVTSTLAAPSASGAEFYLPAGTYTLGAYKYGSYFPSTTLTVTGNSSIVISGSYASAPIPVSSDTCLVYGYIVDLSGVAVSGHKVEFHTSKAPAIIDSKFVLRNTMICTTNASGYFSLNILAGAETTVYSADTIKSFRFIVPTLSFIDLSEIIPV